MFTYAVTKTMTDIFVLLITKSNHDQHDYHTQLISGTSELQKS